MRSFYENIRIHFTIFERKFARRK